MCLAVGSLQATGSGWRLASRPSRSRNHRLHEHRGPVFFARKTPRVFVGRSLFLPRADTHWHAPFIKFYCWWSASLAGAMNLQITALCGLRTEQVVTAREMADCLGTPAAIVARLDARLAAA